MYCCVSANFPYVYVVFTTEARDSMEFLRLCEQLGSLGLYICGLNGRYNVVCCDLTEIVRIVVTVKLH